MKLYRRLLLRKKVDFMRIKHLELNGAYPNTRKIIIDACEFFGKYEIMALYEDGAELFCETVKTRKEAIKVFDNTVLQYAGNLQKALYNKLTEGKKYTLVYFNEFGFPVAEKITFHHMEFTTYAQYSDVVKMIFMPYRKRKICQKYFYNTSLMIFEGWQDLKESDTLEIIHENQAVKTSISKYSCFDARYIEDLETILKNPIVVYKDFLKGKNGKLYA